MTRAVIAMGANLGRRAETIDDAIEALRAAPGVDVIRVSTLHDTVAVGLDGPADDRPRYLNGVAILETSLAPAALLALLHAIEDEHGRERHERWGDRTLDLDLVVFGDHVEDGNLVVPHPRAHERDFVLRPWLEIDAEAVIPGIGRVADLVDGVGS